VANFSLQSRISLTEAHLFALAINIRFVLNIPLARAFIPGAALSGLKTQNQSLANAQSIEIIIVVGTCRPPGK
jgi:hypothetical protein